MHDHKEPAPRLAYVPISLWNHVYLGIADANAGTVRLLPGGGGFPNTQAATAAAALANSTWGADEPAAQQVLADALRMMRGPTHVGVAAGQAVLRGLVEAYRDAVVHKNLLQCLGRQRHEGATLDEACVQANVDEQLAMRRLCEHASKLLDMGVL